MTRRFPRGLKSIAQKYETSIAKLARQTVAAVTGSDAPQWSMAVEPLGTGSWGVVWPLADERFIVKLTADPTEGPIIATIMAEPQLHDHMAIIHYFALKQLPELFSWHNKPETVYVIIAERLQHSSQVPAPAYGFAQRLGQMKAAAGALVHEQNKKRPAAYKVDKLYHEWMDRVQRLNDSPLEDFIINFYDFTRDPNEGPNDAPSGGVLADIHFNNVGKRVVDWTDLGIELSPSDYWVINDPGHSSLLEKPSIEDLQPNPRVAARENPYLPLDIVLKHVPAMRHADVSAVARSPQGFLTAYRRASGDSAALSDYWDTRRAGFIARHMAQVRKRREPLFDATGSPTRRHLALIAWAYSPSPARL